MAAETKTLTLYPPEGIDGKDLTNQPAYTFNIKKNALKYGITSIAGSFYFSASAWGTANGENITFTLILDEETIATYTHKLSIAELNRFRVEITSFTLNSSPISLSQDKDHIFTVEVKSSKSDVNKVLFARHHPGVEGQESSLTLSYEVPTSHTISYHNGTEWVQCEVYYHDGTNWVLVDPYYHNGGEWILCDSGG